MSIEENNIIQLDFTEIMKTSYIDYAMSVIIARALPDVRDGLKPVQRRILYAMSQLGLTPEKPHRKSARVVGDTMGKYHPHGDSSIYDALVNMTKDYSMSIPLTDGHGNFGSIDGDGAAAMRYTEARLSEGAMSMLEKLDKDLVAFIPNFDESEEEPIVLPSMLPNLLINGATGIAVGMVTNIPPHNPKEIIEGVIAYMNNISITTKELMKYILAPDFPTGGIIINEEIIESIYETGEGKIKIRAKTEIEKGENGRKNIVITEIPYTIAGNKTKLVENIAILMKDKVFDEIYDVRDESSKEGIRIIIEVKKDKNVENLLNGLYKKTPMEDTYSVNLLAVKDQQPVIFTLKGMIKEFVDFQTELYTKEYNYLLKKANERVEVLEGLIKATDLIDLIIEILRGSSSIKMAKECLTKGIIEGINFKSKKSQKAASELDFTQVQADAILDMRLSKLIGLEILKLKEENEDLLNKIQQYELILSNHDYLFKVIKDQLNKYKKAFNVSRKTALSNIVNADYIVETKEEDVYITIDKFGYTKTIDYISYTRTTEETLKEFSYIIQIKNTDRLCVFTNEGKLYQIKAANIPKGKAKDKGVLIDTLCKMGKEEPLLYIPRQELLIRKLLFATALGYVKIVDGTEFDVHRASISSTKLEEGDKLIGIKSLNETDKKVILITKDELSLGFALGEVSTLKKTGKGVKGITLLKSDQVKYLFITDTETSDLLYKDKLIDSKKIKIRKRGQKGYKVQL